MLLACSSDDIRILTSSVLSSSLSALMSVDIYGLVLWPDT